MRAHQVVLWGALVAGGLGGMGCEDKHPPPNGTQDGGLLEDGGDTPGEDGGRDGGTSAFSCEVQRQRGCSAGETCLFYQLADGGPGSRCFGGACDVVRQECPSGQRCTYVRQDGGTHRACVEEGTADEGAPCQLSGDAGYDTCKKGLFCTDVASADGGTAFQCTRLCHDTAQCTAPRECTEVLRLEGTVELPLSCGAPAQRCDLLAQDCTRPLGCYPASSTPVCAREGGLGEGASCEFSNQCERGSACVRTGAELTCRKLCRHPSGEPACATGSCQALQGNTGVGACVP